VIRLDAWSRRLGLPPVLTGYWAATGAMTICSLIYTETMIHGLHSRTTLGPLVLWNNDRWWDFLVFQDQFQHFGTAAFWSAADYPFTYPPAMAIVFAILYRVPHALRLYLLGCVAALCVWAWAVAKGIARPRQSLVALLFSITIPATAQPVWLLLGSANTEGLVAMAAAGGVLAVLRQRWWLGAALIAVAASMKIFPLALLLLLLSRRRYVEFAAGLVLAGAITVASLAVLGPTIPEALRHVKVGLAFVKQTYALNTALVSLDYNHSLFSPIKFAAAFASTQLHLSAGEVMSRTFDLYSGSIVILGLGLWWLRIRFLPMLNQVLALTICAVLLPPYSVDYTLIHLFVPCGLLCVYAARARDAESDDGLAVFFTCFAFIFTVGTYFTAVYRFGSQVRMAGLAVLLIASLRRPLPWPALDGTGSMHSAKKASP